jgi:hypothetical protein
LAPPKTIAPPVLAGIKSSKGMGAGGKDSKGRFFSIMILELPDFFLYAYPAIFY